MKKIAITQNMNLAEDMLEKLEEASINAELKNGEDSASVWGSVTMSNLEIWVDDENVSRAQQIVTPLLSQYTDITPSCPSCDSQDADIIVIHRKRGSAWLLIAFFVCLIVSLLLSMLTDYFWVPSIGSFLLIILYFFPHDDKYYKCRKCGHTYRRE